MDEERRSFWDQAMWVDEHDLEPEPQQTNRPELLFIFDYELPPALFTGPTPHAYEH